MPGNPGAQGLPGRKGATGNPGDDGRPGSPGFDGRPGIKVQTFYSSYLTLYFLINFKKSNVHAIVISK